MGVTAAGNPSAGAMLGAPFSYGGGPNFSRLTTTESISTINQRSTIKKAANQAASNARQRGSWSSLNRILAFQCSFYIFLWFKKYINITMWIGQWIKVFLVCPHWTFFLTICVCGKMHVIQSELRFAKIQN